MRSESSPPTCYPLLSRLLFTAGALLFCPAPSAQPHAESLRSPGFLEKTRDGFDEIFNLDFDEAFSSFERLAGAYPSHPGPPLYMATAIWLKELFERQELDLDKFISPSYFTRLSGRSMPTAERTRFQDLTGRSLQLSEAIVAHHPDNPDARYFLGAAYGVLGSFAITVDHSRIEAFRHGKNAYRYHIALIDEDPEYFDAYLTAGVYEYVVGSLPWYLRFVAALAGYTGSKSRGFEYVERAVEKGQFVSDSARTVQLVLLIREKKYQEALRSLRYLKRKSLEKGPTLHRLKAVDSTCD